MIFFVTTPIGQNFFYTWSLYWRFLTMSSTVFRNMRLDCIELEWVGADAISFWYDYHFIRTNAPQYFYLQALDFFV